MRRIAATRMRASAAQRKRGDESILRPCNSPLTLSASEGIAKCPAKAKVFSRDSAIPSLALRAGESFLIRADDIRHQLDDGVVRQHERHGRARLAGLPI